MITELIFQPREDEDISRDFFARQVNIDFPKTEEQIVLGETAVFSARGRTETNTVQQIIKECFQEDAEEKFPICQFNWGTLYFSPRLERYILMLPGGDESGEANSFLISGFPVLEAIRRKITYDAEQSKRLSRENFKTEYEIKHLQPSLLKKLSGEEESLPSAAQMSDRLNVLQNQLYNNISQMERTAYGIEHHIRYFEKHLAGYPLKADILFQPLPEEFRSKRDSIERDIEYTRFLLPAINQLQDTVRFKFDWLRQKTLEKNNRLLEYQHRLIAVFAVAIGVGLILPEMHWIFKLLSMVTSGAVTLVVFRQFHHRL